MSRAASLRRLWAVTLLPVTMKALAWLSSGDLAEPLGAIQPFPDQLESRSLFEVAALPPSPKMS